MCKGLEANIITEVQTETHTKINTILEKGSQTIYIRNADVDIVRGRREKDR